MVSVKHTESIFSWGKENSNQLEFTGAPLKGNLSGIRVPVYKLGMSPAKDDDCCGEFPFAYDKEQTILDSLLLAQWEDLSWKGQLRYDVTSCATKVVGGRRFIAQLNESWNPNFITEPGTHWPLGNSGFKDMKIHKEDILFCVATGDKDNFELIPSAAVPRNSVMIVTNANPVEFGHVYLLPWNLHQSTQFSESLESVVRVAAEIKNCSFRVFYDQPASSNFNHIFFQACYFANHLPVELMPVISVFGDTRDEGINICEVADYPVKALMFATRKNMKLMVEIVSEICSDLQDQNVACSLLISDCGRKIFLFLQGHTLTNSSNLSAWECGGHFVFKASDDFDQANEECIMKCMSTVSLDDEGFQAVKQLCLDVANKLIPVGHSL